jgi:uncharacterized coiled-coil DUF342 family protein
LSEHQSVEEQQKCLTSLKDEKDRFATEAEEATKERDKLNGKFQTIRAEISGLKVKRDELNQKVQELKQKRAETKAKISEKVEQLKKLRQGAKTLEKKKPRRSQQDLQKEFADTEWKIQTSSLNLQEEKELVERVRRAEVQLNIYRKLEESDKKELELRIEVKALDVEGKACHERLTQIAQSSQETHEKMLHKIEESRRIKAEADSYHQEFIRVLEKIKAIRQEIDAISEQVRQIKAEMREKEVKEKKLNEDSLRSKLGQQAAEKLKRGEKLTWEEFKLLSEKETETQD